MGKPISEALAEIDKCAGNCAVVADQVPHWLADHEVAVTRIARGVASGSAIEYSNAAMLADALSGRISLDQSA